MEGTTVEGTTVEEAKRDEIEKEEEEERVITYDYEEMKSKAEVVSITAGNMLELQYPICVTVLSPPLSSPLPPASPLSLLSPLPPIHFCCNS